MTTSRTLVYRRVKGQGEAVFCKILLCMTSIRVDQREALRGEGRGGGGEGEIPVSQEGTVLSHLVIYNVQVC
jgi:hypothetical protein